MGNFFAIMFFTLKVTNIDIQNRYFVEGHKNLSISKVIEEKVPRGMIANESYANWR